MTTDCRTLYYKLYCNGKADIPSFIYFDNFKRTIKVSSNADESLGTYVISVIGIATGVGYSLVINYTNFNLFVISSAYDITTVPLPTGPGVSL
jgi:hypothetical protein